MAAMANLMSPASFDAMALLDRVIFHLTVMRQQALWNHDIDEWQHMDLCVWLVRKVREAKSFEL